MSWISDLAGRAEDFLVKIDKNAAVAAQTVLAKDLANKSTPSHSRRDLGASAASDFSSSNVQTVPPSSFHTVPSMSDLSKAGKSKVDRDAALMASLNMNGMNLTADTDSQIEQQHPNQNGNLSLQQENSLLKQEIKSLSQEIRQAMQSAKQADKDKKAAQQQLKTQSSTSQSVEQQLSTLRKENMSLADQILDKDAELVTLRGKVSAMYVEQEHQTKIEHLQAQLDTELRRRKTSEEETKHQIHQFEREKSQLVSEVQQNLLQMQSVKEELALTYQSFNEYKLRAQRILQDKDRLLQDIKQQQTVEGLQPGELLLAELSQLQQERDLLREETAQSSSQLQQCRKEIALLESKYEEETRQMRESFNAIETRLADERIKKESAENELRQVNDELRYIREDMSQQKVQSAGRIQQLEVELTKVRQQLTNKENNSNSASQAELTQRLRSLTDTLVAKQAALEAVQSERSSLLLQLERVSKMQENDRTTPENGMNSTRVLLNITDDELAKVSTGVSRRMRHAYSTLDSLNFRLGQALRRRPAARLVLFCYMVFLHFWVAFVLLTYTPEMHDK